MRLRYARTTASVLAAVAVIGTGSQVARAQNAALFVARTTDDASVDASAPPTQASYAGRDGAAPHRTPKDPPVAPSDPQARRLVIDILRDQRDLWTSPLHLHGHDAAWLAPVFGVTAALIASDKEVNSNVSTSPRSVNLSNHISDIGSGYALVGGAGATYLVGHFTHDERARRTGLLGLEALIDTSILVTALKVISNRERPNKTNGRQDFLDGGRAFPSGHAASSWALAEVVAEEYRDRPVVRWSAYGLAAAVSVARVTSLAHSPSDVFVGGVIGYLVGRHVVRRGDPGVGHISFMLTPIVSTPTRTFGVSGSLAF